MLDDIVRGTTVRVKLHFFIYYFYYDDLSYTVLGVGNHKYQGSPITTLCAVPGDIRYQLHRHADVRAVDGTAH